MKDDIDSYYKNHKFSELSERKQYILAISHLDDYLYNYMEKDTIKYDESNNYYIMK